jgi:hypothetical protein
MIWEKTESRKKIFTVKYKIQNICLG